MQLSLQDFRALVRIQAAAVGSSARTLIDLSVGSVLRAVLEANASVALWVQWLIMEVLSTTRAATSTGADLDSWVADFGLSRLVAVPAQGEARFIRQTTGLATTVPVGAIIRTGITADAQTFQVVAGPQLASWMGSGYSLQASASEVVVPIQAVIAGRAGNVQAGVLTLLSTAIPGVDSVINDYPATGGLDAETDDALRARFGGFIDSRSQATEQAITFAVQSVQQGLQFAIAERVDPSGAVRPGHFTIVIDDGSGAPSSGLIGRVMAAVEVVRPVGSTYSVIGPRLLQANVVMKVIGGSNLAAVQAAVGAYIGLLPIYGTLAVSKVVQLAHDADPAVVSVSAVTLNGSSVDLGSPPFGRITPGTVTVQS